MDIQQQLDQLSELMAQRDVMRLDHQAQRDALIPEEIKAQLRDLELEQAAQAQAIDANIVELEAEVKRAVIAAGASVKGARLHAVLVKGRVTWDTKGVEGFALAHPELMCYRREGDPSVSIRGIGK